MDDIYVSTAFVTTIQSVSTVRLESIVPLLSLSKYKTFTTRSRYGIQEITLVRGQNVELRIVLQLT